MQLINGKWFNGEEFIKRTFWVEDGLLYFDKIENEVDTVLDLSGKFVIPPFAEAHNHNLESDYELEKRIDNYLKNGVFYVKHLSAIRMQLEPLMHLYNKPSGLDVSTTYAPLTGTGGHPVAIREKFFDWGYYDVFDSKQDIESHGYFIIDSEQDLNKKWGHILSFEPDFIKINLLYSEEYEKRKNDPTYFGKKGLNPNLVNKIVEKAHTDGLRVSAHVETAYDFHVAVEANVDEVAHLPEITHGQTIDPEDIKMAKEKGITIVTTVSLIRKRAKQPNFQILMDNIRHNLKQFKKVGAKLAVGSDNFNGNSAGEFQLLQNLGVFTNLELLKMWTENSTETIFPNRKVGKLFEGYEASFLVLETNPLENIVGITEGIELRIKQGTILN
ncbi:amidohydrolase family protein [Muricauda sp. JGD-17]|uniref:Amidohydrolase family protein n=1 Tax=Flagellimonas ochracea TaxID=2696472 RepID=A0A964TD76_9FLAO|nr:amidohydrolase family protein [Allomuricauda ochracea]NAY92702.1 amidohydrolase family protein [Allomuricauda ochracea]